MKKEKNKKDFLIWKDELKPFVTEKWPELSGEKNKEVTRNVFGDKLGYFISDIRKLIIPLEMTTRKLSESSAFKKTIHEFDLTECISKYLDYSPNVLWEDMLNKKIERNSKSHQIIIECVDSKGNANEFLSKNGVPVIKTQPKSQEIQLNNSASFVIFSKNLINVNYQWQKFIKNGFFDFENENENKNQLLVKADEKTNGISYRCIVKNNFGETISEAVTLSVIFPSDEMDSSGSFSELKPLEFNEEINLKIQNYLNFVSTASVYNKIEGFNQSLSHDKLFVNIHLTQEKIIGKGSEIQITENVEKILKTTNPSIIIGAAGSGKTTLTKNLMLYEAKNYKSKYIPVFFEIKKLKKFLIIQNKTLQECISKEISISIEEFIYFKTLDKNILLILDGLDEAATSEELEQIITATERFLNDYSNSKIIFTCRHSCSKVKNSYNFELVGQKVDKYFIEYMTEEEQTKLINNLFEAQSDFDKEKFCEDLNKLVLEDKKIDEMRKNPMLLSLLFFVYRENSIDGGKQGSFPKSKIDLYDSAAKLVIKKDLSQNYLSKKLTDHIELLLGRIALIFYEKDKILDKNNIEKEVDSYISTYITSDFAEAGRLTTKFLNFIENRSLFMNTKFTHQIFKEYFAAKYLYFVLFKTEEKRSIIKIANYFNNNDDFINTFLCYVDKNNPDKNEYIPRIFKRILKFENPQYGILCKTTEQFIYYHNIIAASKELIISMFVRVCEKKMNPFFVLFLGMSEYNLNACTTDDGSEIDILTNAYEIIKRKYSKEKEKLYIADICYHLYRFLYLNIDIDKTIIEKIEKDKESFVKIWLKNDFSALIWTKETEKIIDGKGNLLYLDKVSKNFSFGYLKYISFIKVSQNSEFSTYGTVLYSKNRTVLHHHIRRGNYNSEFTVPETVTKIDNLAFAYCKNLKKIIIPDTVIEIGDEAFANCSELIEVTLSKTIEKIGKGAFTNCTKLAKIILPDSLKEINAELFSYCEKLDCVTIPDSVNTIGEFAFGYCENLHIFRLPNSLKTIQPRAFEGCKITKFENNNSFAYEDDILFNKEKTILIACFSTKKEVIIPEHVLKIEEYAFSGCSDIEKVTIKNPSCDISETAFYNCSNLSLQSIVVEENNSNTDEKDIQKNDLLTNLFQQLFEINLTKHNRYVEINTGLLYNDLKTEIKIYVERVADDIYSIHDLARTFSFLDSNFDLSDIEVCENIEKILDYFTVRMMNRWDHLVYRIFKSKKHKYKTPSKRIGMPYLYLDVKPNEDLQEGILRFHYCIGFLNNLKIFNNN